MVHMQHIPLPSAIPDYTNKVLCAHVFTLEKKLKKNRLTPLSTHPLVSTVQVNIHPAGTHTHTFHLQQTCIFIIPILSTRLYYRTVFMPLSIRCYSHWHKLCMYSTVQIHTHFTNKKPLFSSYGDFTILEDITKKSIFIVIASALCARCTLTKADTDKNTAGT